MNLSLSRFNINYPQTEGHYYIRTYEHMPSRSHTVHIGISRLVRPTILNFVGVTGLSRLNVFILPGKHRLRPVGVGFVVDKLIIGKVFCQIIRFPLSALFYHYSTGLCKLPAVESVSE